jgi:dihydroxyacetone kinase-like predicted kinase
LVIARVFLFLIFNKSVTVADIDKLRDFLMTIGDCVIAIGDLNLVKVHVHTNNPDEALSKALKLGEIDKVKVENMLEQNRKLIEKRQAEAEKYLAEQKEIGMVSICVGDW